MARGNQRDKAREANQKKMAAEVRCFGFVVDVLRYSWRKTDADTDAV